MSYAPNQNLQLLFVIRGANMELATDQPLAKVFAGTKFLVQSVTASQVSGGATVACAGGIYDAATKGGNAVVGVAQSWINLSAANKIVCATLEAITTTDIIAPTLYLSLTTGSSTACTADIFVYGCPLD